MYMGQHLGQFTFSVGRENTFLIHGTFFASCFISWEKFCAIQQIIREKKGNPVLQRQHLRQHSVTGQSTHNTEGVTCYQDARKRDRKRSYISIKAEIRNLTVTVYAVRLSVFELARKDILVEFRFIPHSQYFNVRATYIYLEKLTVPLLPPFT